MTDRRSPIHCVPRLTLLLFCGIALAAWSSAARAQINPFSGYKGPTLGKEDLAAGREAAGKLLTDDQAEVGKSEDWSGPSSGNQGSISVLRVFKRQGLACRALRSEIRYKTTPAKPRTYTLNVCQVKSGEWKIV